MSRRNPYEVCSRCETWHLSTEMTSVPGRDANGHIVQLRLCPSCVHPYTTYIQGGILPALAFDAPRIVLCALAVTLLAVSLVFGIIIGAPLGFAVAIAGSLGGAGILAVVATSCIQQSS
jgi:uncharacterized membrane-anchored protein YitT (DUF2179 family)